MALGEQGIVGRRALLAMLAFGPLAKRPASAAPSEPEAFIAALGERTLAVIGANGLTPQQLFTWRRLAREAGVGAVERGSAFAAVVLEDALPGLIVSVIC